MPSESAHFQHPQTRRRDESCCCVGRSSGCFRFTGNLVAPHFSVWRRHAVRTALGLDLSHSSAANPVLDQLSGMMEALL